MDRKRSTVKKRASEVSNSRLMHNFRQPRLPMSTYKGRSCKRPLHFCSLLRSSAHSLSIACLVGALTSFVQLCSSASLRRSKALPCRSEFEKPRPQLRHSAMAHQPKETMPRFLQGQAQYLQETGRWGAYVREPKLAETNSWIFLGSHLTQRLAARCQDRALLRLETDPTMSIAIQLTFKREDYEEDVELRKTLSRDQFFDLLREESSQSNIDYQNWSTTACLRKFLAQEKALGNLSTIALEGPFFDIDLDDQENSRKEHKVSAHSEFSYDPIFDLAWD